MNIITLARPSISEIVSVLSQKLQDGYLLHGSPYAGITELVPGTAHDAYHDDTYTAVFATDQPLIALLRGIAGASLVGWNHYGQFFVNAMPENASGYVYLVRASGASQNIEDASEYHYYEPVQPIECIQIVGCNEALELFRIGQDESITIGDMKSALLTIRTMLERIGWIDYQFDMKKQYPLVQRLQTMCIHFESVLQAVPCCGSEAVRSLGQEVWNLFYKYTYDSDGITAYEPMLDKSISMLNKILRVLNANDAA